MSKIFFLILTVSMIVGWINYPKGKKIEITIEHQLLPTIDTVIATHWHRVDNKFYVLLKDSIEKWVDNVTELK